MTRLQSNEVGNIAECNLLHDTINTPKCAGKLNSHYSPILHGCMNTKTGIAKLKNICILLSCGCSSTIVIGRLVKKLGIKEKSQMQWNTQSGNIKTFLKVKIDFTIHALSMKNVTK